MDQPDNPSEMDSPADGTVVQGTPEMAQTKQMSSPEIDLGASEMTELSSPEELLRSRTLAKRRPQAPGYEILRPLGAGAFGEVWLARQEGTPIEVAVKFFAHGTSGQWQQLQEEVKQLALLNSVHGIIQLMDVCADARPPYYVMAYAPKGSLADRLEKGPLNLAESLAIFRKVTAALDYVHAKGIRHCDLKPANILLDALGDPLIADFGQAHFSSDASPVLGTFFYMAPEQADLSRQIPDTRWDVYGLGALIYAMLTGAPPRENVGLRDQMRATAELSHRLARYREWIPQAPPPRAHRRVRGMDRELAQVIDRCLEVDPKRRLPNAGAVLASLKRRERRRRQRPLLLFGLVAPLVLLAVVTGMEFSTNEATIAQVETKLTGQLLDSDHNSARLIANAVQENLRGHLNLLLGSANRESGLYDAIVHKDRTAVAQKVRLFMGRALRANLKYSQAVASDDEGRLLAIVNLKDGQLSERDPDTLECTQFAWRDWFSGQGDRWDEMYLKTPRTPSEPITVPHVSDPYVSLPDKFMLINISVPVLNPDKREDPPVGVLTASIKLDEINQWLLDVDMKDGFPVLLDKRRYCLLHRDKEAIRPEYKKTATEFKFSQLERQIEGDGAGARLSGKSKSFEVKVGGIFAGSWMGPLQVLPSLATPEEPVSGAIADYHDPVDDGQYLAAYAQTPDNRFGWIALVQHDRAAVLKPIDELRGDVRRAGWRMLGLAVLLTTLLWGWLFWTLRRAER